MMILYLKQVLNVPTAAFTEILVNNSRSCTSSGLQTNPVYWLFLVPEVLANHLMGKTSAAGRILPAVAPQRPTPGYSGSGTVQQSHVCLTGQPATLQLVQKTSTINYNLALRVTEFKWQARFLMHVWWSGSTAWSFAPCGRRSVLLAVPACEGH